jgi:hypothetical protein
VENKITDKTIIVCQWDHCEALASKHVLFGFRKFAGIDGPCCRATASMTDHYDLCDEHTEASRDYYFDIDIHELADCPNFCA